MIGGNPAVSKASPVLLSGALKISAPQQSDSAGPERGQTIPVLTQPQVILRHPKFENHGKSFSPVLPSPPIPVMALMYSIMYVFKYMYRVSAVCHALL